MEVTLETLEAVKRRRCPRCSTKQLFWFCTLPLTCLRSRNHSTVQTTQARARGQVRRQEQELGRVVDGRERSRPLRGRDRRAARAAREAAARAGPAPRDDERGAAGRDGRGPFGRRGDAGGPAGDVPGRGHREDGVEVAAARPRRREEGSERRERRRVWWGPLLLQ